MFLNKNISMILNNKININNIQVIGLYDVFDHNVELNKENITLILGENGLGKTIILRIIKSF
ncbi:AAA family ATPase, partial [Sphingobacterium mizutaii]|uniref:AAA family ATPase n=1 Tax=Sphingobacterium mizutaii TaxID=1010 RepID=UPI0035E3BEA1